MSFNKSSPDKPITKGWKLFNIAVCSLLVVIALIFLVVQLVTAGDQWWWAIIVLGITTYMLLRIVRQPLSGDERASNTTRRGST